MTNFSSPGRARIDVKFRILPSVTMKKVSAHVHVHEHACMSTCA